MPLQQRVKDQVTAHPIVARTVCKNVLRYSLLEAFCEKVGAVGYETIRFLIEMNPQALLWVHSDPQNEIILPIHVLAASGWGCALLPWIAKRYPWVFQHELCQENPPHLRMMTCYIYGVCELETVREFYEIYPQGLSEKDKAGIAGYPLALSLKGDIEPDAELFIWMARQYPKAVYDPLPVEGECNVLHGVCMNLTLEGKPMEGKRNLLKIGRFLISEHESLVREKTHLGNLPIHKLVRYCDQALVQELAIVLMKVYPDFFEDWDSPWYGKLRSIPFIHLVHPRISDELKIDRDLSLLKQSSQTVVKAAVAPTSRSSSTSSLNGSESNSLLVSSLSGAYLSWAKLRIDVLSSQKRRIQEQIADICRALSYDDASD